MVYSGQITNYLLLYQNKKMKNRVTIKSALNTKKKNRNFFNRHPNGIVDRRTDLYYVESSDLGETWNTADQQPISIPVTEKNSPSRVEDYASLKKIFI